jgi:intracellular multiplication protein IcmL
MSESSSLSSPEQMSRLLRITLIIAVAVIISSLTSCIGVYLAFTKKPIAIAATDQGRVIPIVPLDKPYVTDSRVIAFSEECSRRAFSHDFVNFRLSLNEASRCFTSAGSRMFLGAMDPMLKELIEKRMIMSASVEPPVVVRGPSIVKGRVTWSVQAKMQLFREGQRERITPQSYVLDMSVVRVDLEENVRGIAIEEFVVRPAAN